MQKCIELGETDSRRKQVFNHFPASASLCLYHGTAFPVAASLAHVIIINTVDGISDPSPASFAGTSEAPLGDICEEVVQEGLVWRAEGVKGVRVENYQGEAHHKQNTDGKYTWQLSTSDHCCCLG